MLATFEQPPLINVTFTGEMALLFGKSHRIRGYSVQELISGICANIRDLKYYILREGSMYKAFCGDRQIGETEVRHPVGSDTVTIEPVAAGSGGGAGKIIGGIALIAIGVFTGGSSTLILAGVASVATGAAELLSPRPQTPNSSSERESSFLFDSLGGTSRDSDPIQLPYGEGPVSGIPLSQAVTTADIAVG